jgi:hypothetical protein
MNDVQKRKRKSKMEEKACKLRKEFWPNITNEELWDRTRNDGYTTVPRTMPFIMEIINNLSNKGQPAGQVYFVLWCHVFYESSLIIENPLLFAAETGFSGERALTTWKQRMKTLQELGFIDAKAGSSGDFHYVLILNPHVVIPKLKERIQDFRFRQIYDRAIDIGAKDFETSHE